MVVEHVATKENQQELGEKLGPKVVIMSQRSWRRLRTFINRAERQGVQGLDWTLNVVLCDLEDEL